MKEIYEKLKQVKECIQLAISNYDSLSLLVAEDAIIEAMEKLEDMMEGEE